MLTASLQRISAKSFVPAGIFFAMIAAAAIGVVIGWPSEKSRAVCDEAVRQLLTTKDFVELERSKFLIRSLDCSVRRRLP
jgi:hypothetical protein